MAKLSPSFTLRITTAFESKLAFGISRSLEISLMDESKNEKIFVRSHCSVLGFDRNEGSSSWHFNHARDLLLQTVCEPPLYLDDFSSGGKISLASLSLLHQLFFILEQCKRPEFQQRLALFWKVVLPRPFHSPAEGSGLAIETNRSRKVGLMSLRACV